MLLRKGQKFGFYDHSTFVPADYDAIRFPRMKGYVRFYRGEKCGFIDAQGQWTQNIDEAHVWSEGEVHPTCEDPVQGQSKWQRK